MKSSRGYSYPRWMDVFSLLLMFLILGIELIQLKEWLKNYPLYYIFSFLGLLITVTALYSPNLVSVITSIALSLTNPGEESAPDIPRFGPAEILEKKRDYEGALMEYMVLARIYPYHSAVYIRIANVLEKLGRLEEGMDWLRRSWKYLNKDSELYSIVARYCDLAEKLDMKQDAIKFIDMFLDKYPDSKFTENLTKRKELLIGGKKASKSISLVSLEAEPLSGEDSAINELSSKVTLPLESREPSQAFGVFHTDRNSSDDKGFLSINESVPEIRKNGGDEQKGKNWKRNTHIEPL
ncbi:MAG: tetratricopeptide repeat protein [Candidatus Hydrogenedentes bacterium]|nr:tetratricopeptide repeat protein [Candidatus Hydrogenedentota bacterium]